MKKIVKMLMFSALLLMVLPLGNLWAITLVRVGYIDIDAVIETYTARYLETEIMIRQEFVRQLQDQYRFEYDDLSYIERMDLQDRINEQKDALSLLSYNSYLHESTGEIRDSLILQIVQRDIMEAIKKTSELEGFSLVLNNSGNFIYGSEDINLTDKVLFRLDEKLLDLENSEPLAPLRLELENTLNVN
jgi:Skp family chaperone for outer membrane proteins